MSDVAREALDHIQITAALSRYYQAIDTFDWKALEDDVMAPEAVWEVVQAAPMGSVTALVEGGRGAVIAWFVQMMGGEVNMSDGTVRHFLSTHVIDVDGDAARSVSHLQAFHTETLQMLANGKVTAEHRRTDGGWRISRCRVDEQITDADMAAFVDVFGLELDPPAA
jgi:hypothetical protein